MAGQNSADWITFGLWRASAAAPSFNSISRVIFFFLGGYPCISIISLWSQDPTSGVNSFGVAACSGSGNCVKSAPLVSDTWPSSGHCSRGWASGATWPSRRSSGWPPRSSPAPWWSSTARRRCLSAGSATARSATRSGPMGPPITPRWSPCEYPLSLLFAIYGHRSCRTLLDTPMQLERTMEGGFGHCTERKWNGIHSLSGFWRS